MEETSAISMELVLAALIALAVLLILGWYILNSKIKTLAAEVQTLRQERSSLEDRLKALEEAKSTAAAAPAEAHVEAEPDVPQEEAKAPAAAETAAAAASQPEPEPPMAAEPTDSDNEIPPEVVAVIMAAVAACGYSPAQIRSIRRGQSGPQHQNRSWVMAGRLAGMR